MAFFIWLIDINISLVKGSKYKKFSFKGGGIQKGLIFSTRP